MNAAVGPNDTAAQSYVDKWLAAQPAQRLALVFVAPERRRGAAALAALEYEWLQAAYGIREPQVAAVKLNWWAEELAGAAVTGGRHPLIKALWASDAAASITTEQWLAPIMAALAQLDTCTPADFAAQLQATEAMHGAFAALETAWWFGSDAEPERATRMASLGHLLRSVAQLGVRMHQTCLPLPMARLARHGLDRESLAVESPARDAALREQLSDIAMAYAAATALPGPLSPLRGLDARLGQRWSARAAKASPALSALLVTQSRPLGARTLWAAWRAGRASQRTSV